MLAFYHNAQESFIQFMELGGNVLWWILLVVLILWTFIIERYWYYTFVHPGRMKSAVKSWDDRKDTTSWYAKRVREYMVADVSAGLNQSLLLIKTLIAICPLLGLLGTVTGMVQVFDVMAITGTGNARAMAAGVSKATVPTMAGMVAALSGVFFISRLETKAMHETEKLEDMLQHH